ncbi:hypothetical protein PBI_DEWDROP_140 [Microbacterium phage Dewdrop]|nr:hypothetical protein PBI_LEAF_140 [Microbacterium phage Leaf]QGZ17508.1 hypothetical protein PBI_DEWDROP_140 [Microbacterium phage Dewdrop]
MVAMSDALVIDLSNYKDRVGARVIPGRYRVIVEDVEADQSKQGNPMVNLWFRIQGGEFDGQTLVDRLTITEKALFRVVGFMNAIGLPTPKKKIQIVPQKFLGQVLEVDVDDGEPYNGRVKSEIRGYIRVPKSSSNAQQSDGLEEFTPEATSNPAPAAAAAPAATEASSAPAASAPVEASGGDEDVDLNNLDL